MLLFFQLLLLLNPPTEVPLLRAHAHNDYLHPQPLFDALRHGFCSVEADIFVDNNKNLLVGHTQAELKPERTLENLYLKPLQIRVMQNQGSVYPKTLNSPANRFILLIDLKTDAVSTYPELHKLLANYADMLTEVRDGHLTQRAVTVIVSGSRPSLDTLARQSPRFAGLDGRLSDLDSDVPSHLMPMISDNWMLRLGWGGTGTIPDAQREKLENIIKKAHNKQRLVRFWAVPEKEAIWQLQLDQKVDLINTDRLSELKQFLNRKMNNPDR